LFVRRSPPATRESSLSGRRRYDPVPICDNVTIVTRDEWAARAPKVVDRMGTPVSVVIIHHATSGECADQDRCAREVRGLQNYFMDMKGMPR